MADFNSDFWHWYVVILTVLSIAACFWLLQWMSTPPRKPGDAEVESTGHVWDGDLTELNNPLPRWWLGLFYITLVFSAVYLLLYPGLGSYQGYLDWSSEKEYQEEVAAMNEKVGPLYANFRKQDIPTLATDEAATRIGERLFASYCATCHGSDARGARGYPNLRDTDWLWGGSPEAIKTTLQNGRQAAMPAWEAALGGEVGVTEVTQYVLSLSGRSTVKLQAENGEARYKLFCVACHGADGRGNPMLGAPNLTDDTWLYGASISRIQESIAKGRNGKMPAHGEFLGEDKVHLLSAYVYGLSQGAE